MEIFWPNGSPSMHHQAFWRSRYSGSNPVLSGITSTFEPIPLSDSVFFNSNHQLRSVPASTTSPGLLSPQPVTNLRLSSEELKICEKWITPYSTLSTIMDRLKMLREAILPRLSKVNVSMAEEAWKARKSVSIHSSWNSIWYS